eukprot:149763-Amphidinium_carterae.1
MVADLRTGFAKIRKAVEGRRRPRVAFLEWLDPLFTGGHWVPDMMEIAGADYQMCKAGERSKRMEPEELTALDAEYIIVGPCGFDVQRAATDTLKMEHSWWQSLPAVRAGK